MGAEHWATVVEGLARRGVRRVRLTGGEPLMHPHVVAIARAIAAVDGIEDVAITTNGTRLADLAMELRDAGVRRLNLSIDSRDPRRFFRLTRGGRVEDVLAGLDAAQRAGFELKTNTVVIGGDDGNFDELPELARFLLDRGATPRFLELMTVGEGARIREHFIPFSAIRERLAGLLLEGDRGLTPAAGRGEPAREPDRGPAVYLPTRDGRRIGFITGTSDTFCSGCDRLRVSSDGQLRPCLATNDAVDISAAIRTGDLAAIGDGLAAAWAQKPDDAWGGCTEPSAAGVDMRATGG